MRAMSAEMFTPSTYKARQYCAVWRSFALLTEQRTSADFADIFSGRCPSARPERDHLPLRSEMPGGVSGRAFPTCGPTVARGDGCLERPARTHSKFSQNLDDRPVTNKEKASANGGLHTCLFVLGTNLTATGRIDGRRARPARYRADLVGQ
jgi:hypothetical protein